MHAHDVRFAHASGSSGGVMAALAMLGGADLNLGIRQCFDLRSEPSTCPGSARAFFAVYREYFRAYRSAAARAAMPVESLSNRLYVRVLRHASGKGWHVDPVTHWSSEQELEDCFMSAAYIPFGTSILPPMFRGSLAFDAGLGDLVHLLNPRRRPLFASDSASLWPASGRGEGGGDTTRCVVVSHRELEMGLDGDGLAVIRGRFSMMRDFWASKAQMRRGFVEGFQHATALIDGATLGPIQPGLPPPAAADARQAGRHRPTNGSSDPAATALPPPPSPRRASIGWQEPVASGGAPALQAVMTAQRDWKATRGYTMPSVWPMRDSVLMAAGWIMAGAMLFWPAVVAVILLWPLAVLGMIVHGLRRLRAIGR